MGKIIPDYSKYNNPQGQFFSEPQRKRRGKSSALGLIGFILSGILFIAMLAEGKATPADWAISAILFAIALLIQRKLLKKGCLLNFILWLITGFVLFVVLTFVTRRLSGNRDTSIFKKRTLILCLIKPAFLHHKLYMQLSLDLLIILIKSSKPKHHPIILTKAGSVFPPAK